MCWREVCVDESLKNGHELRRMMGWVPSLHFLFPRSRLSLVLLAGCDIVYLFPLRRPDSVGVHRFICAISTLCFAAVSRCSTPAFISSGNEEEGDRLQWGTGFVQRTDDLNIWGFSLSLIFVREKEKRGYVMTDEERTKRTGIWPSLLI